MSHFFRREEMIISTGHGVDGDCPPDNRVDQPGQVEVPRPEQRHSAMNILAYLWQVFRTHAKRPR